MTSNLKKLGLAALAAAGLSSVAFGQYANGNLALYFQNPSDATDDNVLLVDLGPAHLLRGGSSGPVGAPSLINIVNIGTQLSNVFGSDWADQTSLWAGAAGNQFNFVAPTFQLNEDGSGTSYVSRANNTLGAPVPTFYNVQDSSLGNLGGGIQGNNSALNGLTILETSLDASNVDTQNPFVTSSVQGTAFGVIAGGVQQRGSDSTIGSFGPISNVEFALDIYRIIPLLNSALTEVVAGSPNEGTYEGTVFVDNLGNVSFAAIPEPSMAILIAGLGAVGFLRRRRA